MVGERRYSRSSRVSNICVVRDRTEWPRVYRNNGRRQDEETASNTPLDPLPLFYQLLPILLLFHLHHFQKTNRPTRQWSNFQDQDVKDEHNQNMEDQVQGL